MSQKAQLQDMSILNPDTSAIANPSRHTLVPETEGETEHSHECNQLGDGQISDAHRRSSDTAESTQTGVTPGKRKRSQDPGGRPLGSSMYHRLFQEEQVKLNGVPNSIHDDVEALLDHPQISELSTDPSQVMQLRLLYLAIGSCQSLIDFKEKLRAARDAPTDLPQRIGLPVCPTESLREICHLDDQEILCVLFRRYHVVKLFETELETLHQSNEMIVDTPMTFGKGHRARIGNPAVRQEAALTDRLLRKVKPELEKGTKEFQKFRVKISRLRRLAKVLRMLTEAYGFGILALLPCGPTYSELALTDNMLVFNYIAEIVCD
jgi:hypothetical protein